MTSDNLTLLGKVTSVYGIKGWVKVYSDTEPMENIFSYGQWFLNIQGQWTAVKVKEWRNHGKGLVALLDDTNDRDVARKYCGCDIAVAKDALPPAEDGELYYYQLEGLLVVTTENVVLGRVSYLFNTGSNDVLFVAPSKESTDGRERMVPYLEQFVTNVDLEAGVLTVDWDPEF